jgi:hypothetical protein
VITTRRGDFHIPLRGGLPAPGERGAVSADSPGLFISTSQTQQRHDVLFTRYACLC